MTQLGQSITQKNKLLGITAHDLHNPLASVLAWPNSFTKAPSDHSPPKQTEVTAMFADVSRNRLNMVNELLDASAIEAGQFKITLAPTDLAELISKSVYMNRINAARKKTVVDFDRSTQPMIVRVDTAKIRQVVDNLLSNAIKYSPLGSAVAIAIRREPSYVRISVRNQEPGIPEKERSSLFNEFGTLSVQPTGGEKSTGLGLGICRRIVEAHQGVITAVNLPDRGCEFAVTLPLE